MGVSDLFETKLGRRKLLNNMVMMGAGATLAACTPRMRADPKNLDPAILNFALNLEYLEGAFYLAAVGQLDRLPGSGDIILPDGFDGTKSLPFENDFAEAYAIEIAEDELAHVEFLRSALGADAAERPTIDLNNSFKAAAGAAFGTLADGGASLPFTPQDFNPFAAEVFFLHGAFIFEDVGVTAYKGAAQFVKDTRTFLGAAASILGVEAYHAGEIRLVLYGADGRANGGDLADGLYGPLPIWNIVEAISDARDSLDGPDDLDQGITVNALNSGSSLRTQAHGGANIVPTDENSIVFGRTPRQVANIVFLSPDNTVTAGGFFPDGITIPAGLEDEFSVLLDPDFPNNL